MAIDAEIPVGNTIGKKDEQGYGRGIKQKAFVQVPLCQCQYRPLKTVARAINTGDKFKRAWKHVALQPFDQRQMIAGHMYIDNRQRFKLVVTVVY